MITAEYTIILPWPSSDLSPNGRLHWSKVAKAKASHRRDAGLLCIAAGAKGLGWDAAHIDMTFNPPTKRRFDIDGLLSRCKAQIDGLADATGIDDYGFSITIRRGEVIKGGQVVVKISRQ